MWHTLRLDYGIRAPRRKVVVTSVTNNSPSQDSNHPDDLFQSRYVTSGFKPFSYVAGKEIIDEELEKLLHKGALEQAPYCKDQFISNMFLFPTKTGDLMPVINLRPLYKFAKIHFKMENNDLVKKCFFVFFSMRKLRHKTKY